MDVWQNLFVKRLRRLRIPNAPAVVSVSMTRTPAAMNARSHLREVSDVHPEENALLNK